MNRSAHGIDAGPGPQPVALVHALGTARSITGALVVYRNEGQQLAPSQAVLAKSVVNSGGFWITSRVIFNIG